MSLLNLKGISYTIDLISLIEFCIQNDNNVIIYSVAISAIEQGISK